MFDEDLPRFYMGVDLGKQADYTAISIVECDPAYIYEPDERQMASDLFFHPDRRAYGEYCKSLSTLPSYKLRYLERAPLKTPYPRVVEEIKNMLYTPELRGMTQLVVDATGVGTAVVDMMKDEGLRPVSVTIHGGDTVQGKHPEFRVPKRDLVGSLVVLLQSKRLQLAKNMPRLDTFVAEAQALKVRLSQTGHDSYAAWREGEHDDLVLSVSMACWFAEKQQPRPDPEPVDSRDSNPEELVLFGGGGYHQ